MSVVLKHSPADVVRYLLVQLGLGTLPGTDGVWPVFVGLEPDSPDNVVTVYDTAGRSSGRAQKTGETFYHYGVQVRVRSADFPTGLAKAETLKRGMSESIRLAEVAVGATTYVVHALTNVGSVLNIGRESPTTRRRLFTINALVVLVALN